MKNDKNTTISELKEVLLKFREERDWAQFHNPKDLAEAIIIEAGELLELFRWKKVDEIESLLKNEEFASRMKKELADIVIFCLNFANTTKVDVSTIVLKKIEENYVKYSVEKAKGSAEKYDKL